MTNSTNLWEAWKLAQAYRTRPSEIYAIKDEVVAWSFDRAVYLFGSSLENELKEAQQGAKNSNQARSRQQRVLAKWLQGKQRFRDPAGANQQTISSEGTGPVKI